uniref:Killer cell lectin-like receptor 2 n=1 Tax=Peromyscus maniculatus bairdii TaxID=230844 RepID=A0A8C8UQW7_PERMB
MSDEEVTYTTVRFHKSSGLQNGGRSDETQGPREAGHGKCLVPWHLIAIPLGVLCSILLVTVAVLVTHRHWFCYGVKCYFIMDNKHWSGCNQTCQGCSLSLLKIDDDDELKLLKSRLTKNSYWIGLKYDEKSQKWQWIGNGPSKLNLMTKSLKGRRGCAFLNFGGIRSDDCGIKHPCVCEKRMDKFPD